MNNTPDAAILTKPVHPVVRHAKTGSVIVLILTQLWWTSNQVSQVRTDNAVLQIQMTGLADRVSNLETHQREAVRSTATRRKLDASRTKAGRP